MEPNEFIRLLRKSENKTQGEIAKIVGVSTTIMSYYESRERIIPLDIFERLSDYYHVPLHSFFTAVQRDNAPQNLKKILHAKKISLTDLHKGTNIAWPELYDFDNELGTLSNSKLNKIAEYLDIPVMLITHGFCVWNDIFLEIEFIDEVFTCEMYPPNFFDFVNKDKIPELYAEYRNSIKNKKQQPDTNNNIVPTNLFSDIVSKDSNDMSFMAMLNEMVKDTNQSVTNESKIDNNNLTQDEILLLNKFFNQNKKYKKMILHIVEDLIN